MIEYIIFIAFFIVLLIYVISSIIWTIIYNIDGIIIRIKKIIASKKANVRSISVKNRRSRLQDRLLRFLHIDSKLKFSIVFYSFFGLIAMLPIVNDMMLVNRFLSYLWVISIIITLIAIGHFIHGFPDNIKLGLLLESLSYFVKIYIVIVYPLLSFRAFLDELNILLLFFTVGLSLIYTILLIKYVVDSFPWFPFQLFNFLLLIVSQNIIFIGLSFGMYYLKNYDQFVYFDKNKFDAVMSSSNFEYLYFVIYKGLTPFFSFPDKLKNELNFTSYIPVIEHLIGYIFNLVIVGFFMSYSVTMMVERKKAKLSANSESQTI